MTNGGDTRPGGIKCSILHEIKEKACPWAFKEAEDEKIKDKRRGDNLKVHHLNSTITNLGLMVEMSEAGFVPGAGFTRGKTADHLG
jgi:hypothetical protein